MIMNKTTTSPNKIVINGGDQSILLYRRGGGGASGHMKGHHDPSCQFRILTSRDQSVSFDGES